MIWTAAVVAVIAVLQTLKFPPVIDLLATYWHDPSRDPTELTSRGSTTFSSSIATGDYMIIALTLLLALAMRGLISHRETALAGSPSSPASWPPGSSPPGPRPPSSVSPC